MFQIGEVVIHKHDVCKVVDIIKDYRPGEDYYKLVPLEDESLTIRTPVANKLGLMRPIMSKDEARELINKIPSISIIDLETKSLGNEYKKLLSQGTHEDLIRIIKTAHVRQSAKLKLNQKVNEQDKIFFRLAEKTLYSEVAVALDMPFDQARQFIIDQVTELIEPTESTNLAAQPA